MKYKYQTSKEQFAVFSEVFYKDGWKVLSRYITIETNVRDKPDCVYTSGKPMRHRMIHTLLLCVENCWHELEYVKNRREQASIDMYKSQDGRPSDY